MPLRVVFSHGPGQPSTPPKSWIHEPDHFHIGCLVLQRNQEAFPRSAFEYRHNCHECRVAAVYSLRKCFTQLGGTEQHSPQVFPRVVLLLLLRRRHDGGAVFSPSGSLGSRSFCVSCTNKKSQVFSSVRLTSPIKLNSLKLDLQHTCAETCDRVCGNRQRSILLPCSRADPSMCGRLLTKPSQCYSCAEVLAALRATTDLEELVELRDLLVAERPVLRLAELRPEQRVVRAAQLRAQLRVQRDRVVLKPGDNQSRGTTHPHRLCVRAVATRKNFDTYFLILASNFTGSRSLTVHSVMNVGTNAASASR